MGRGKRRGARRSEIPCRCRLQREQQGSPRRVSIHRTRRRVVAWSMPVRLRRASGAGDLRELEAKLKAADCPKITRLAVAVRKPRARWVRPEVLVESPTQMPVPMDGYGIRRSRGFAMTSRRDEPAAPATLAGGPVVTMQGVEAAPMSAQFNGISSKIAAGAGAPGIGAAGAAPSSSACATGSRWTAISCPSPSSDEQD